MCVFLELIINRGERIVEFLFSLAFEFPLMLRLGRRRGAWCADLWHLAPDPAEWRTERGSEGETLDLGAVGLRQAAACGRERLGCLANGIDVQANLVLEHVRIENDSGVSLETFPDHPSKRNAGETVTCAILHRSTPDI